MTEHDPVNHPRHYTNHPSGVECIEISRLMTSNAGQALQYVWRADFKNGLEDLRKARFYLGDAIAHGQQQVWLNGPSQDRGQELIAQVIRGEEGDDRIEFLEALWGGSLTHAYTATERLITAVVLDEEHTLWDITRREI